MHGGVAVVGVAARVRQAQGAVGDGGVDDAAAQRAREAALERSGEAAEAVDLAQQALRLVQQQLALFREREAAAAAVANALRNEPMNPPSTAAKAPISRAAR